MGIDCPVHLCNGIVIPPLVIIKGERLSTSWIPNDNEHDWRFSCNSNGWTSNIHGYEWLRRCFEPATREKASGRVRILICDGHDSHITANFLAHCIQNNVRLLLLPPHTSHLLQPLDVGLFGPLKKAMASCLDPLIRTGITRLQKIEWLQYYTTARAKAFTITNIQGGWRGAGLFPSNRSKVFRHLPPTYNKTPPPQASLQPTSMYTPFDISQVTSSPPNATVLRSANTTLNQIIATQETLQSPVRKYIRRLTNAAEQFQAELSISRKQCQDLQQVVTARKKRKSGKRVVLEGEIVLSKPELYQKVALAKRKQKRGN